MATAPSAWITWHVPVNIVLVYQVNYWPKLTRLTDLRSSSTEIKLNRLSCNSFRQPAGGRWRWRTALLIITNCHIAVMLQYRYERNTERISGIEKSGGIHVLCFCSFSLGYLYISKANKNKTKLALCLKSPARTQCIFCTFHVSGKDTNKPTEASGFQHIDSLHNLEQTEEGDFIFRKSIGTVDFCATGDLKYPGQMAWMLPCHIWG